VQAEEGMWTPSQMPQLAAEMERLGVDIDLEGMSDLTAHPMNAVIWLGGCTASFVSPQGLIVTNHHCAYGSIQFTSREDKNYLESGFLAADLDNELPAAPGTRVYIAVEIKDVTDQILTAIPYGATGRDRYKAIENVEKRIVASCEKDPTFRCRVSSFDGGLSYRLFKQLQIEDVRLVHAPAGAVGKYGGDIDNWMWPRHTGDYSFFRAYVGPDGKPAPYSEDNVPYEPKHWLRIGQQGVTNDEFVMVVGYPGRTNRYHLAAEVKNRFEWSYPIGRDGLLERLEIIARETENRPDAALKCASMVSGLNNASKNYSGMLAGYGHSDVVERKLKLEADLQKWIESDPERSKKWSSVVSDLSALIEKSQATQVRDRYYGGARRGALASAARTLYRLSKEREKPNPERDPGYQERDERRIKQRLQRIERTYDKQVDRALARAGLEDYIERLSSDQRVEAFDEWFGIANGESCMSTIDKKLDELYEKTKLGELDTRLAWMDKKPHEYEASDDPFIQLAVALYASDRELDEEDEEMSGQLQQARPRFMAALIAYFKDQGNPIYSDANSTLRVTYGTVKGYAPRDAVVYTPFTTVKGLIQKETGEDPFDSPEALLNAVREKDFGSYKADALESLPVNFLSTVDTTGGNSGSPTINARGELVGLLFDGNWESIIADWDFIPSITRSIHVDIRYTLWVMDRIDHAWHLLEEMGVQPQFKN
jgi:hypothetical protein